MPMVRASGHPGRLVFEPHLAWCMISLPCLLMVILQNSQNPERGVGLCVSVVVVVVEAGG